MSEATKGRSGKLARVPVAGGGGRVVDIDPAATDGAVVGVNLRRKDGSIVTESDLGGGGGGAAGNTRQILDDASATARRRLAEAVAAIDAAIARANALAEEIRTDLMADVNALDLRIDGIDSQIFNESEITPGLVQQISGLQFEITDDAGHVHSYVADQFTAALAEPDGVIAQRLAVTRAEIEDYADALVASEATARAGTDAVLAQRADIVDALLDVVIDGGSGLASSQALDAIRSDVSVAEGAITANSDAITLLDSRLTTSEGTVAGQATAISNLNTRVTTAEGTITAQGSSLSALSASVGDVEASVASLDEVVVSGPNAILARHSLLVNANGKIAGMVFNADSETTSIDFLASTFRISTGTNPADAVTPFTVAPDPLNGGVPTVFISDAKITNLEVERINGGTVGANWAMGSGNTITCESGGMRRIMGSGFGDAPDAGAFVDWYGPSASSITRANAIYYMDTAGVVYSAGGVIVGAIVSQQSTTSLSAGASVGLTHIGTRRAVNITISYAYSRSGTRAGSGSLTPTAPTATLAWSWTDGAGLSGSGSVPISGVGEGSNESGTYSFSLSMSGGTSPSVGAGNSGTISISASLSARSVSVPGGTSSNPDAEYQSISIIASEG